MLGLYDDEVVQNIDNENAMNLITNYILEVII